MTSPSNKSVAIDGRTITYRELGEGPGLILLHGIGSNAGSWTEQLEALSDHHRVLAWDAPGYGGSTPLPIERPVAADYAKSLKLFLDELGIEKCCMVGHSLGALMAASFVRQFQEVVGRLVLASCAAGYGAEDDADYPDTIQGRLEDIRLLGPKGLSEKRSARLLSASANEAQRQQVTQAMSEVTTEGYEAATHMLARSDIFADIADIKTPTLVLCGSEDVITPEAGNIKIANAIGGAQYRSLPGLGHACYIENSEAVNDALRWFCWEDR